MERKSDFIALIKNNEGIIFKITSVYSSGTEDQKDLYQEIVYQLWKSFDTFRNESSMSTWIYRVALNTSITHLKKEKRKPGQVSMDFEFVNMVDEKDHVLEERLSVLYAHIKMLSVIEKSIVLLYLEGKNYDEIATITGFSASNVGTRLSRIKQKLKSQIKIK